MVKKLVFLSVFLLFSGSVLFGQSFLHSQPFVLNVAPKNPQANAAKAPTPEATPETTASAQQPEPTQAPQNPAPVEQAKAPEAQPQATPTQPQAEAVTPPAPAAPAEQTRTPKYKVFKVGDNFIANTLTFTLKNITLLADNAGNKPEPGKVYLSLEMSIENTGDDLVAVNSFMLFRLKDDNGTSYSPEANGELAGKLGPGRIITGQALFQVPEETKYFALEIDPSVVGAPITHLEISTLK